MSGLTCFFISSLNHSISTFPPPRFHVFHYVWSPLIVIINSKRNRYASPAKGGLKTESVLYAAEPDVPVAGGKSLVKKQQTI
jgi:hypothetical protein